MRYEPADDLYVWILQKQALYGIAAGIASKLWDHPFDTVKGMWNLLAGQSELFIARLIVCAVRLQSQPLDKPAGFAGPIDCFKQTITNEGVQGLYRVRAHILRI